MSLAPNPVSPLLVVGLAAVAIAAVLSMAVWFWAMRRPSSTSIETTERGPLLYVAVGAQVGLGLDGGSDTGKHWADLVRDKMPEGTRLVLLGRRGITLSELNQIEIPAAVKARPNIVTLWNAVSDATNGVPLEVHIRELRRALSALLAGTQATILLLNLPDISLVARDVGDEQRTLIRGGVQKWNRDTARVAARYGRRVRPVDLYPISEQLLTGQEIGSEVTPPGAGSKVLADTVWTAIEKERLIEKI